MASCEAEVLPWQITSRYGQLQRLLPTGWPQATGRKAFPWQELSLRFLEKSLAERIERLYEDVKIGALEDQNCLSDFFCSVAASQVFQDLWAGESRGPFLLPVPFVQNLLTLDEIQHGLATESGRKPCESALTLTDGVDFRCPISLPPLRQMSQMLEVLEYGTIFLNTASLHWKAAAELCLEASYALQFPCNINVYVTGRDRKVSTDVHTDNHDVLIFHTQGAKHWRVYAPPARSSNGQAHPLYRGKNEDKLLDHELGPLLVDVILQPGQVLFVPMGFPHATGTAGTDESEVSVHLTLGLSTADYEFCWGGLRKCWLQRVGRVPKSENTLPDQLWWRCFSPLPVGFLARRLSNMKVSTDMLVREVGKQLVHLLQCTGELKNGDEAHLPTRDLEDLVAEHLSRQVAVLASQEEAYREVISCDDGVFLATGPEDTSSEYRRSMLCHQIAEDERKRRVDNIFDPRYVKRIDPADGVARTLAEVKQRLHGVTSEEIQIYWDRCPSIYPKDQPPLELLAELQRASDSCEALLYFLQKRTPQLRTSASCSPSHRGGCCLATRPEKGSSPQYPTEWVAVD